MNGCVYHGAARVCRFCVVAATVPVGGEACWYQPVAGLHLAAPPGGMTLLWTSSESLALAQTVRYGNLGQADQLAVRRNGTHVH